MTAWRISLGMAPATRLPLMKKVGVPRTPASTPPDNLRSPRRHIDPNSDRTKTGYIHVQFGRKLDQSTCVSSIGLVELMWYSQNFP